MPHCNAIRFTRIARNGKRKLENRKKRNEEAHTARKNGAKSGKQTVHFSDRVSAPFGYFIFSYLNFSTLAFKCVATLAKDFLTSLSENHSPNVATAIFMPRTSPSPHSRSRALSPSALSWLDGSRCSPTAGLPRSWRGCVWILDFRKNN